MPCHPPWLCAGQRQAIVLPWQGRSPWPSLACQQAPSQGFSGVRWDAARGSTRPAAPGRYADCGPPPGASLGSICASASTRARAWPVHGSWRAPSTPNRTLQQRKSCAQVAEGVEQAVWASPAREGLPNPRSRGWVRIGISRKASFDGKLSLVPRMTMQRIARARVQTTAGSFAEGP